MILKPTKNKIEFKWLLKTNKRIMKEKMYNIKKIMKLQQWDNKTQITLKGKMIKSMLNSSPNMEKMTQNMQLH